MFEQAFLGQVRLAQAPPEKPPTQLTEDQLKKAIEDGKKKIDDLEKKPQRSKDDEDDLNRLRGSLKEMEFALAQARAHGVYLDPFGNWYIIIPRKPPPPPLPPPPSPVETPITNATPPTISQGPIATIDRRVPTIPYGNMFPEQGMAPEAFQTQEAAQGLPCPEGQYRPKGSAWCIPIPSPVAMLPGQSRIPTFPVGSLFAGGGMAYTGPTT